MFDVAVVGAGVVGGFIARELVRRGASVCMLEKAADVSMGASGANSGIVHAGFDAKPGSLKARFNVLGAQRMERVAQELGVPFRRCGSLVVAFRSGEEAVLLELLERGRENGVQELQLLSQTELRKLEPDIAPQASAALWAPSGSQSTF